MKTISFSIFCRFQCTNIAPGFFQKHVYMLLLVVSNFKCTLFKYRKISSVYYFESETDNILLSDLIVFTYIEISHTQSNTIGNENYF